MPQIAEPVTQATLVAAVCASPFDTDAWSRFVRIYGPHVIDWCRRFGLQEDDARDVAQDVLMQFLRQASRFQYDPARKFRGYLRTITHAAWCNWVEKARRHQGLAGEASLSVLSQLPSRDELSAVLEARYDRELLDLAIAEVKQRVEPHTWEVFRLLAVEGLSGKEVATRTGMKIGSAFAARHKVQRMLKDTVRLLDA